jgi:Zn-dependent protease with chaperone function/Tfp pilus assembly major pilin PilA
MDGLVYPREKMLSTLTLVLGVIVWLVLLVGTFGTALIGLALGFLIYLFTHSMLISYIKGNGVELSETQFSDLHAQFVECCDRLEMVEYPKAYILQGNGSLNAFATKFLGTQYVVLLSDIVDAMEQHTDGVRFYIGHELGHLRMKHLSGHFFRWPVLWLPLLGAAYSRARESTCDRHGLACSSSPEGAAQALAALSAGSQRWKQLNIGSYLNQVYESSGFWMSFHELTAGYPWLTKRVARVMDSNAAMPKRNGFAYVLAVFVPYAGRLGAGFGFMMMIYIVGLLAAIAIPQYKNYVTKAKISTAISASQGARQILSQYYQSQQSIPKSLDALGIPSKLADGSTLSLNSEDMVLTLSTSEGDVIFTPGTSKQHQMIWNCTNGKGLKAEQVPPPCIGIKN